MKEVFPYGNRNQRHRRADRHRGAAGQQSWQRAGRGIRNPHDDRRTGRHRSGVCRGRARAWTNHGRLPDERKPRGGDACRDEGALRNRADRHVSEWQNADLPRRCV